MGYLDELLPSLAMAYGGMFPRLDVTQQVERPVPDTRAELEAEKLRKSPGMLGVGGIDPTAQWFPPAAAKSPGMLPDLLAGASNPAAPEPAAPQQASPNDPSFGPGVAAPYVAPYTPAPAAPAAPPVAADPANAGVEVSASRNNGLGGVAPTQQPAGPAPITPYERFNQTLSDNRGTLMALASGFAGSRNFGEGMSRAFERAAPVMVAERKNNVANQSQRATYQALIAKGVPKEDALAAAMNADVMKSVVSKYFETKPLQPHEIGKDFFGNPVMGAFNPNTGKYQDVYGNELTAEESSGKSPMAHGFAKGVTAQSFDANQKGDGYLNQFSDEVKASVKNYIDGKSMPTGNARQGYTSRVKEIAQKYGQDIGVEVSDDLFKQRAAYRGELGKNSANSAGGQAKAFSQSIEHLDHLVDSFKKQGNFRLPGGALPGIARAGNEARQSISGEYAGKAKETDAIGQILAGEVGKLFSGAQGGGVHEREMTMNRFKPNLTPDEFAGAVAGTLSTLEGGLKALNDRRDAILGPNNADVNFLPDSTKKKIAKVLDDVDEMRGLPRGTTAKSHPLTFGSGGHAAAPAAPAAIKPQTFQINGKPVTIERIGD